MPFPIKEVVLELPDNDGRNRAKLLIKPTYASNNLLAEATTEEALEWGEETIQLLEESEYEFELTTTENLRVRELPGVVKRSVLNGRENTGKLTTRGSVGLLLLIVETYEGEPILEIPLEVRSSKIEYREHYRHMLNYIAEKCTDLLMQVRAVSQGRFVPNQNESSQTIAQRYFFLKALLTSIEFRSAIARILSSPHQRSTIEDGEILTSKGIRPGSRTLRQIAKGNPRFEVPLNHPLRERCESLPVKVSCSQHIETVDTAENRFVKYALESFDSFLSEMGDILENRSMSSANKRLWDDIEQLRRNLTVFLSHSMFREISAPTILPLGSPVLQRREGYRELLLAWLRFDAAARLVWSGGNDVYGSGKRDISTLYEYWIFFKLLDVVAHVFGLEIPKLEHLIEQTEDGFGLKLKAGKKLLIEEISDKNNRSLKVRFSYNKAFSKSGNQLDESNYPDPGSWTRMMRPDYTLSLWPAELDEHQAEKLELMWHIHFDSKYKVNNSKSNSSSFSDFFGNDSEEQLVDSSEAMNSDKAAQRTDILTMHAYRDAIRRTEGAYIIYPGNETRKWRKYHEILPGLGAFAISPDAEDDGVRNIEDFLNEVAKQVCNRASLRSNQRYYSQAVHLGSPENVVFARLQEALPDGNRPKPLSEQFVVGYSMPSSEQLSWIHKHSILAYPILKGVIFDSIFKIEFVILNNEHNNIDFYKITKEIRFVSKDELLQLGYPQMDGMEGVYALISIEQVLDSFLTEINLKDENLSMPFIKSLDELLSSRS